MPKSTRKSKAKTSESSLPSTPDQWTRLQESLYGLLSVEIDDPFTDLDHLCPRSAWLVLHMDLILPTQPAQPLSLLVERALDALAALCVQSESLRVDEAEYEGYWQRVLSCDMMKEPLSKTDPLVYKFARFARCKGVRVLLSWRRKKLQASTIKALSNFLCSRREKYREYFLPPSRLSLKPRCVLVGLRLAECNLATKDVAVIQELLVARPSSVDCSLLCDQESLGCLDLEGNRLGPEELSSLGSLLEKSVRQVNGIGLKDTVPDDPVKSTSPKYIQAFKGFLAEAFKSKVASTRNDPVSRIDEGVALSLAGNTLCDGVHLQVLYEVLQGASRPLRALSLAGTTHTVSPAGSIADLVTQKIFAKLCFLSPATSFTEDSTLDMSATKSDFIFESMDILHDSLQDPILRMIPLVQAALESGETVWCRVRYNDPRWWAKYAYYIEPSLEQNTRASGVWVDPSTAMKVVSIRSDGWLQVEVPQCDDNGEESTSSTPTIRILWIQVSKLSALYSHSLDILGMRFRGIICNSNGDGRSHRSNHLELLRELTESCVPIVTRLCLRQWNHKRYYLGRIVDRCPQLQEFDVQGSKIDNYPLNVSAATVINLSGCELSSNFFEDLLECDENTLFRHRYLSLLDTKLDDALLSLLQKAIERFTNLVLVDADSIATIKAIGEVGFGYSSVSACETEILREVVSKARRFPPEVIENIISQTNGVSVSLRVRSCTLSPLPQWRIQAQDGQKS